MRVTKNEIGKVLTRFEKYTSQYGYFDYSYISDKMVLVDILSDGTLVFQKEESGSIRNLEYAWNDGNWKIFEDGDEMVKYNVNPNLHSPNHDTWDDYSIGRSRSNADIFYSRYQDLHADDLYISSISSALDGFLFNLTPAVCKSELIKRFSWFNDPVIDLDGGVDLFQVVEYRLKESVLNTLMNVLKKPSYKAIHENALFADFSSFKTYDVKPNFSISSSSLLKINKNKKKLLQYM